MKVLITHEEIVEICKRLGGEITEKFKDKNPLVICVLKGACPFHSELIKYIDTDIQIDYIQVSSYLGTQSTGNLIFKKDVDIDMASRDVIIVEDIIDTGFTLHNLKKEYLKRNPNSLTIVTLLNKPSRRKVDIKPDLNGMVIDDLFVVGFGLDYNEKYRNLKDICVYN